MRKLLRILRFCFFGLVVVVASGAALFGYFVYSPEPEVPPLSGTLTKGSIEVGGLKRTYVTYIPRKLPNAAPLLLVMHGSGENAAQIRTGTGYGFERLADEHGFAIVYPNAYTFDWNDCSKIGDFKVSGVNVDDVGFLNALVDKLAAEIRFDRGRIFATGVSAGGSMSIRLALEAPSRFRAVAAVSANVPTPENFKCKATGQSTSIMIMNGSKDPLVPYNGGEVNLLGLFYKGGNVRSSRESVQYFVGLNKITGAPETKQMPLAEGINVEQVFWRSDAKIEVKLVTIHGGGHGIPQPYSRRPRLLGPSPMAPNGPAMIWAFFDRQRP
jgi:polyhydroxybutyrate depolymerase